jgi:protein-tyrosine phosphatase
MRVESSQPTRTLSFSAMLNFRDVGGYTGLDGLTVRWRRLFRSDSLHRLGDADRETFSALGVRTVVDLRRPDEVDRDGRVPAHDGLRYHHIHPEHEEWRHSQLDVAPDAERFLADRYLELVRDGHAGLAAVLQVIADERSAPVVVHCVAGKDRTGVVCALTLSLLGVADVDIAEDYALSAAAADRFTRRMRQAEPDALEVPGQFIASPVGAMLLFLRELRQQYGSTERYAAEAGVSASQIDAMREHLLT